MEPLVGASCWSLLLEPLVGASCWSLLLEPLVGASCWSLLLEPLVGASCWSLLLEPLVVKPLVRASHWSQFVVSNATLCHKIAARFCDEWSCLRRPASQVEHLEHLIDHPSHASGIGTGSSWALLECSLIENIKDQ